MKKLRIWKSEKCMMKKLRNECKHRMHIRIVPPDLPMTDHAHRFYSIDVIVFNIRILLKKSRQV